MSRKKTRRLAVGRILQAGLVAAVALFACVLLAGSLGFHLGSPTPTVAYLQLEEDVKQKRVSSASVDGNILLVNYGDHIATAVTPDVGRSVELMIKNGVKVEALRAVPASGVNLPVLGAVLLPYAVLAWVVIGMISAAHDGINIDVASWEPTATSHDKPSAGESQPEKRPLSAADA